LQKTDAIQRKMSESPSEDAQSEAGLFTKPVPCAKCANACTQEEND